ncbi:hypothetical protein D9613_000380 [Agrocybe pediades]|uniref:Uncharacterized protein n=1 Tax=Agrocybe pediades TaxID=84607 RepID=A0A8H4R0H2_9AGAR|nr:hypothetical protein D9613_000380 [Agrocybe pediades]KAF9564821.1 hypothetical protein CPC08DRAFT_684703 [Agrocybe pediades]
MAPKFLCCLPLRLGVLVISLIQFVICGATAGLLWFFVHFLLENHDDQASLPNFGDQDIKKAQAVAIALGVLYTLATAIGILGFFGALFKKTTFVKIFRALLFVVLILQLASAVLSIVLYYWIKHHSFDRCTRDATDDVSKRLCDFVANFRKSSPASIWVSSIVPVVILGYACYVVHHYSKRLGRQEFDKNRLAATYHPVGTPAPAKDESMVPLTQPAVTYPYSDAPHSFGRQPQQAIKGDIDISNRV